MKNTKLILLTAAIQALLGVGSIQNANAASAEDEAIELQRQQEEAAKIEERKKEVAKETAPDFYVKTRGYRVEPESDPPSYVRNLSKTQFEQFKDVTWLDVGLDFRTRYEYRENDYRSITTSTGATVYRNAPDNPFLLRTRGYLGIKNILDPLRAVVEFQDSRMYNSKYEPTVNDVDEFTLIQAYGELYFEDALGLNRPLSIRAGRQSFELLDKRLFANNQFRNTANSYDGFRVRFGKKENNWDLDTFAFHPVERLKYQFDRSDERTWLFGSVLSIKEWSKYVTIQPYFFGLEVDGSPYDKIPTSQTNDSKIYAPGLRLYGVLGDSGFDFDADVNKQFGRVGNGTASKANGQFNTKKQVFLRQDAIAYSLELGYTFNHDWKPRASVFYGYGSGDKSSKDGVSGTFNSLYGFNQPWSRNDTFTWTNISSPKARIEFTPYKDLRVDAGYGAFWLASGTDKWAKASLSDTAKRVGDFVGQEFDVRVRHQLNPYIDWSVSYSRFEPGSYSKSLATANGPYTDQATNFFYFEATLNAFGDGKPKR